MGRLISRISYKFINRYGVNKLVMGIAILLMIVIVAIALHWLYYKLVLEKRFDNFLEENQSPVEKQKFLAAASLYSVDPYTNRICLRSYYLQNKLRIKLQKQAFKSSWSIIDSQTALNVLNELMSAEDSKMYESIFDQLNANKIYDHGLYKLVNDAENIKVSEDSNIDPKAIYDCSSIEAWNYIRGANVARISYNLGYLSEDEAWYYLENFTMKLKKTFGTWEAASFSFLLGRFLWSNNEDQSKYIETISSQFTHFEDSVVSKGVYFNMWQRFPLQKM
ncbi:DUF1266 domain-containing protein [Enterococcus gilvus]|uniref:DUF1266 domain-containing protein n=1 Tax=Enterococcus gilvus TaxID=160453 RepID=UPI003D6BB6E4